MSDFEQREGDEHAYVETHDSLPTSINVSAWLRYIGKLGPSKCPGDGGQLEAGELEKT